MPQGITTSTSNELTEREQEILKLLATGTSNKDIANRLFISSNTVKVHLRNIFAKIGAASRTEAAMYAVQIGLVRSPAVSDQGLVTPSPAEDDLTIGQSISADTHSRSVPLLRLVSLIVIILILVLAVGLGYLLTRQQLAVAANNNQIVPPAESRWNSLAPLPIARDGLGVTVYENQIYAIGGESVAGVTGSVERYDPSANSWVELSSMPVPVADVNTAVIGGKIYVPGGRTTSGAVTDTLEIYDPAKDSWEMGKTLPIAMSAYAMAAFEGRLFLFGGWDGTKYLESVLIYDPTLDRWAPLTSMRVARAFAGAAVVGDKIYVVGGYNGKQALKVNEVYTPHLEGHKNPWEQAEELPIGRYNAGVASVTDNIYLIGGQSDSTTFLALLPQAKQWQIIDSPPFEMGNGLRLVQLGELLLAIGGKINNSPSGNNVAYRAIYTVQIQSIIKK